MAFDSNMIFSHWHVLLTGFWHTMYICFFGLILGLLIGAAACAVKMSSYRVLRILANVYIELFRGTPFLVQLFILYFVGPEFGLNLSALTVGILGIGLYGGAYFAEIFRSGILSIPKGQIEAAKALGFSRTAILLRIVIPQMLALILAPLTNQLITLIKDSSILSIITVKELTFTSQSIISETYNYVEVYAVIALLYWVLSTLVSLLTGILEKRLTSHLNVRAKTVR
jgi:polar amino acid transport system permease protein